MKVFTINHFGLRKGMKLDLFENNLHIGAGSASKKICLFKKNLPEVDKHGFVYEAFPVRTANGFVLAKPNRLNDERVLVLVMTRDRVSDKAIGRWTLQDSEKNSSFFWQEKVIEKATGPKDFYFSPQLADKNVAWNDALLKLLPGDIVIVKFTNGKKMICKYESVEKGLIIC
ncbi:MAG TPA: hypothetical protein P5232_04470 [Candidatus Moranbacteria bacterium]|nr:hypothetical protein [Candidatus Moranbacteria bacterium]